MKDTRNNPIEKLKQAIAEAGHQVRGVEEIAK